jgi:hypothetical protein
VADYSWPTTLVAQVQSDFHLEDPSVHQRPPVGAGLLTLERSVHYWQADITFQGLSYDSGALGAAEALLVKLGLGNRVLVWNHAKSTPVGAATGTPLINGSVSAGATTLTIRNATPNVTNWLRAGDMLSVSDGASPTENIQLFMAVADVNTNGSGQASVPVRAATRWAMTDGMTVGLGTAAVGRFALLQSPRVEVGRARIGGFTISLIEDTTLY